MRQPRGFVEVVDADIVVEVSRRNLSKAIRLFAEAGIPVISDIEFYGDEDKEPDCDAEMEYGEWEGDEVQANPTDQTHWSRRMDWLADEDSDD